MKQPYDVIIIGGGMVGNAITREMSKYRLKMSVLEKSLDVCYEASGRNSSMIRGGFVYDTGSLRAKLCAEGNQFIGQLVEELDFKFIRYGKVLVDNMTEDMGMLKRTIRQGEENGTAGLELIGKEQSHQLVPAVVGEFATFLANSGIVGPFDYTIALAENAYTDGAAYRFNHGVTGIRRDNEGNYVLTTPRGKFRIQWIVDSAGLGCGDTSDMLGIRDYKTIGSKGDCIILDKHTGHFPPMSICPVPSNVCMEIRATNTTDGSVIIGPSAEMIADFTYHGVPQEDVDYLAKSALDLWPCIHKKDYIRNYSGIPSKWMDEDGVIQGFKIKMRDGIVPRAISLVGIEPLGFIAAVPIVRHAVSLTEEREKLMPNPGSNPVGKGIPHFVEITEEERE